MELFLSLTLILAVTIALIELKERRHEKRNESNSRQLRAQSRALHAVVSEIRLLEEQFKKLHELLSENNAHHKLAQETAKEARDFSEQAKVKLETIVREYELNGHAIGYLREDSSDYVSNA